MASCPPWNPKREYLPPPKWAAPAVHQKLHKPFCRSFLERNHRTVSCRVRAVSRGRPQERRPLTGGDQTGSGEVGARAAIHVLWHRSLTRRLWPRRFSDETSTDLLPNGTPWTTVGAVGRTPCTSSEDTVHSLPFSPDIRQRVLALSAPVEPFLDSSHTSPVHAGSGESWRLNVDRLGMDETRHRLGKPSKHNPEPPKHILPAIRSSANGPVALQKRVSCRLRHSGTRHQVVSHASPPPMSQVRVASCWQCQCQQLQTAFCRVPFLGSAQPSLFMFFYPPTNQIVQQTTTPSFFFVFPSPRALDRALPPCENKSIFLGRVRPLPSLAGASPTPPSSCPLDRFEFSRLRLISFWRAPEDAPPAPRGTLFLPQKAHHGLRRRVCL